MPSAYTILDLTGPHRDTPDLVVDGRPLLHRLDEVEGVDAVSPLASDLPPALRAGSVRGLLLDSGCAAGRRILYSCPDCEDPGCGAVTAVVEREGEDVVWRDFAWQTGGPADPVDLARDGYPGVGPYRFRGDTYRAVLLRLLGDATAEPEPEPHGVRLAAA
ncbi:hypothetical protein ACFRJ7_28465 [Streptomyces sp. NPDC056747]|uniref:hypothetical protein n=1 Tax=Streptomyces sp. NPDC056747 TaxID=3345935 RepID=UPI0004656C08